MLFIVSDFYLKEQKGAGEVLTLLSVLQLQVSGSQATAGLAGSLVGFHP